MDVPFIFAGEDSVLPKRTAPYLLRCGRRPGLNHLYWSQWCIFGTECRQRSPTPHRRHIYCVMRLSLSSCRARAGNGDELSQLEASLNRVGAECILRIEGSVATVAAETKSELVGLNRQRATLNARWGASYRARRHCGRPGRVQGERLAVPIGDEGDHADISGPEVSDIKHAK
jgi:hypothetical protein